MYLTEGEIRKLRLSMGMYVKVLNGFENKFDNQTI